MVLILITMDIFVEILGSKHVKVSFNKSSLVDSLIH